MNEKQWKILSNRSVAIDAELQQQLSIDIVLSNILSLRGINSFDNAKNFFRPSLNDLPDPFLMSGMHKAIERIGVALERGEKILVFGDYDVDGTTAVSIVYSYFKKFTSLLEYYIPDRYKEGYGISTASIDYAKDNDFKLIIALDCGIKAVDKIEYANAKQIDFIICDHHLPGEILPNALAVLDPKQTHCQYPYKELSGAGIGFKLIQAFAIKNNHPLEECYNYLDLVVTSIAADIVPLTGENRILAYYGLEKINQSPRPAIKALLNMQNAKSEVNISTLVFGLGPKINAAGRIEHGSKAVEMLVAETDEEAVELAIAINETNSQRKDLDLGTTTEAMNMLEVSMNSNTKKTTVLFKSNWHKGVVGIVASRLIEKYYKPTIILTESDGKVTGSARSVREYDIYNAIEQCSDLLEQFGGHKFAAGLTLKRENVELFMDKFEAIVSANITDDQLIPKIDIDSELDFYEISDKFLRIIKQLAPHGPHNMTPTFLTKQVFDTGWGRIVGTNHLKLELFQQSNPLIRYNAIAYDKGDYIHFFQKKTPMDVVYKIVVNDFKGSSTTQLIIEDLRVS